MIVGRIVLGVGIGAAVAIAPLLSWKPPSQPFEVDVLVSIVLPLCLLYGTKLSMRLLYPVRSGGFRGYRCWRSRHEKWLASSL